MAIKNLNKYSSPNPLMRNQEGWSRKGAFICRNCNWEPEIYPDPNIKTVIKPRIEQVVQEKAAPSKEEEMPEDKFAFLHEKAIQMHCLPARYKDHKDALYGQYYRTIRYGEKFTFEGIVVEQQDLFMDFWTTVKEVTEGSVIYPMNKDKRWWRVQTIISKTGGLLIHAILSDYQPDFS